MPASPPARNNFAKKVNPQPEARVKAMKPSQWVVAMLLAAVVCVLPARAQQRTKPEEQPRADKKQAATPVAPKQMQKLMFLLGTWALETTYEKTSFYPKGGDGSGSYQARLGPGGFSLLINFSSVSGPEGQITGHEVITWDPKVGTYKDYVFGSNFPGCFTRTGQWDGSDLVLTGDLASGKTKIALKTVYSGMSEQSFTITESFRKNSTSPFELLLTTKAVRRQ